MEIVKPLSWPQAIDLATIELEHADVRDARLNAELLAAYLIGVWTRAEVRAYPGVLSQSQFERYRSLLKRRIEHEPLQYITGETEFFGLRLYCSPAALIPRPDTEILVEEALKAALGFGSNVHILDIGTGSGAIALALASKLPDALITGIDVSEDALLLAEKNRRRCGLNNVTFSHADIYSNKDIRLLGGSDIVVSNPPYIPLAEYQTLEAEVREFEPRSALTDGGTGFSFYTRIFEIAPLLLNPGGRLLLEIAHGAKDVVEKLARGHIQFIPDLGGIDRVMSVSLDA